MKNRFFLCVLAICFSFSSVSYGFGLGDLGGLAEKATALKGLVTEEPAVPPEARQLELSPGYAEKVDAVFSGYEKKYSVKGIAVGAVAGGVAGYVIGSKLGSKQLGAAAGAMIGGAIGNQVAKNRQKKELKRINKEIEKQGLEIAFQNATRDRSERVKSLAEMEKELDAFIGVREQAKTDDDVLYYTEKSQNAKKHLTEALAAKLGENLASEVAFSSDEVKVKLPTFSGVDDDKYDRDGQTIAASVASLESKLKQV